MDSLRPRKSGVNPQHLGIEVKCCCDDGHGRVMDLEARGETLHRLVGYVAQGTVIGGAHGALECPKGEIVHT